MTTTISSIADTRAEFSRLLQPNIDAIQAEIQKNFLSRKCALETQPPYVVRKTRYYVTQASWPYLQGPPTIEAALIFPSVSKMYIQYQEALLLRDHFRTMNRKVTWREGVKRCPLSDIDYYEHHCTVDLQD